MVRVVLMLCFLMLALPLIGCEKRVVRHSNPIIASEYGQPPMFQDDNLGHKAASDDGLGELLFGWTRVLGPKQSDSARKQQKAAEALRTDKSQVKRGEGWSELFDRTDQK